MFKRIILVLLVVSLHSSCTRKLAKSSNQEVQASPPANPDNDIQSYQRTREFKLEELRALAGKGDKGELVDSGTGENQWRNSAGTESGEEIPGDRTVSLAMGLVRGSYAVIDDVVVYSPDAVLTLGNGMVSSPTGSMVSDVEQTFFRGDILYGNEEKGMIHLTDGYLQRTESGWRGGTGDADPQPYIKGKESGPAIGNIKWIPPERTEIGQIDDAKAERKPPGVKRSP